MALPDRGAPFACRLIIMAKVPVAGRVKTRLARGIGIAGATRFFRATSAAVMQRIGRDPRWVTTIAIAPDRDVATRAFPAALRRVPQGRGDLGRRMQHLLDTAPRGPVIVIGTDIPAITAAPIARAFRLLGHHDAVLGPATDGGYWLVGLRRRPRTPRLFARVRWSSPHTLADTLVNLAGLRVAFTSTLADVDEAADLVAVRGRHGRRIVGA